MLTRLIAIGFASTLLMACGGEPPFEPPPDPPGPGTTDVCKHGGDPEVIVGHGFADYYAAPEMDVAEVEAGPQGGYHIWIGARVRNLLQSGSITGLVGAIPGADLDVDGGRFVFTLEQDEGGYCKVFGMRLILADSFDELEPLLGTEVDVTVSVEDADGDIGIGERTLLLSDTVFGE
jgi:hypothetical protein